MTYSCFAKGVKKDIKKAGAPVYIEEKEVLRNFPQNRSYRSILKNLRYSHGLHGAIRIKNCTRYIVFSICEKKKIVDNTNYMYATDAMAAADEIIIKSLEIENKRLVQENSSYKERIRKTSMLIDFTAALSIGWLLIEWVSRYYGG